MSECTCQHCGHRFEAEPEAKHRIRCGDSADAAGMAELIGEKPFGLCFTSPPYANLRDYHIGDFNWLEMMTGVWDALIEHASRRTHIVVNLGPVHRDRKVDFYWMPWLEHAAAGGWPLFGMYVWDKGEGLPGDWQGRPAPSHEFLFHFNLECDSANKWIDCLEETRKHGREKNIAKRFRQKDGSLAPATSPDRFGQSTKIPDSVFRIERAKFQSEATGDHPAIFPVDLAAAMMLTWSQEGSRVLDPFLGSGTSIVAGEQLNRRVLGGEISPAYVDVSLLRWTGLTGKEPVLAATGQTFEEARRDRNG